MMKPERLLAKYTLFQNDTLEKKYIKMKEAFDFLLKRTIARCNKYCDYRANQERFVSMCDEAVPGLIERRTMIKSSESRVLSELEKIDKLQSFELKIESLEAYAKGLAEHHFSGLFMVILSGELNKRWLPLAKEPIPAAECHIQPVTI